jgi:yeast amino acid transporter
MKEFLLGGGWGRLIGFWSVCCQASFSYIGAETIAITVGEVERPRQTVPKAVRRVAMRLNIYYIGAIFVLGLNLSSNDPILQQSLDNPNGGYHGPFVLMAQRAGIPRFGDFLNCMALGASLSVSNASLYVTVRVSLTNTD